MRVRVRKTAERVFYTINCPGCGEWHSINDGWAFNGDLERPTFSPSILVTTRENGVDRTLCHSFVDNGRIRFLGDSAHALAGQTAELLEIEAFEEDVVE